MNKSICDAANCCGCGVCADVCPAGAVRMERDKYGFFRPEIDLSLCVGCAACDSVCPSNTRGSGGCVKVYACFATDPGIRKKSSSGGIFRLLADRTLDRGGVVAAVGYDESFHAVYKTAYTPSALDELMGSKYTEASSDGIYKKVKGLLDDGREVLFVGTPCRVAALKSYTGDNDLLLTADLICHGVPSSSLLESFLSESFDGNIKAVSFRDKTLGWQEFSMRVEEEGKKPYISSHYKDPYLRTYLEYTALRDSCYDCRYKGDGYLSDITLGDFWGISSLMPSMNDDGGTSAVVLRTKKGIAAFEDIKNRIRFRESSAEALGNANRAYKTSENRPANRNEILASIERGDSFSSISERFGKPLSGRVIIKERILRTVKKILGKIKK